LGFGVWTVTFSLAPVFQDALASAVDVFSRPQSEHYVPTDAKGETVVAGAPSQLDVNRTFVAWLPFNFHSSVVQPHLGKQSNPYFASLVGRHLDSLSQQQHHAHRSWCSSIVHGFKMFTDHSRNAVVDIVTSKLNARVDVKRLWQQLDNSRSNTRCFCGSCSN